MLDADVAPHERHVGIPPQIVVTEPCEDVSHLVADGQTIRLGFEAECVLGVACHTFARRIGPQTLDVGHVDVLVEGDVLDKGDGLIEREPLDGEHRGHHGLDGVAQGLLRRARGKGSGDPLDSVEVVVDAHELSAR